MGPARGGEQASKGRECGRRSGVCRLFPSFGRRRPLPRSRRRRRAPRGRSGAAESGVCTYAYAAQAREVGGRRGGARPSLRHPARCHCARLRETPGSLWRGRRLSDAGDGPWGCPPRGLASLGRLGEAGARWRTQPPDTGSGFAPVRARRGSAAAPSAAGAAPCRPSAAGRPSAPGSTSRAGSSLRRPRAPRPAPAARARGGLRPDPTPQQSPPRTRRS